LLVIIISLLFSNSYSQWIYQNNYDSIASISCGSFVNSNTGWYARAKGHISKTTDGGMSWNTISICTDDLNSIKFPDLNTGYVCGINGRLMKTTNGGLYWSQQNSSSNDTLASLDFLNELTGWCAGKNFILYTSNGGVQWNWQNVDSSIIKPRFTVLKMFDSQNGLAGARGFGYSGNKSFIFRTTNGGTNWIFTDSLYGFYTYSISYVNANIVYLSTMYNIQKSTDGGINWNMLNFISSGSEGTYIKFKNESTGWALNYDGIFKTTNGGDNWFISFISTNQDLFTDINYLQNGTIFAAKKKGGVYKSTNEGDNWNNYFINISSDLWGIKIIDANNLFISGEDGALAKSTNGGFNWINKNNKRNERIIGPVFANSNTGFICDSNHYIYKSTDAGDNWYQIGGIFPHDIYNIYCKDDNNLWVVGNFGMIMSSTNLGNMWENKSFDSTSLVYGITKNNNNIFINALTIDNSNRLFKSANMGNNWVNIPIDSLDSFFCLFFLNSQTGWIFPQFRHRFFKTIDGGNSWTKYYCSIDNDLVIFDFVFINENTGFAPTASYIDGILKTTNSGINWFSDFTLSGNSGYSTKIAFINENTGWVVGSQGLILKTTNGGTSFISINNHNIPDKFSLSQNYPNPFNPSTNIRYELPKNSFVKLVIFDMLGRVVETPVNEKQSAGTYEITWDASSYPSGVYFYRLTTEGFSETKKMILLK
jgi:photosystem II stability/assembly factor-like uncharacterized protein